MTAPTTVRELEALIERRNEALRTCVRGQKELPAISRITVGAVEDALRHLNGRALDFCGAAGLMIISGRGFHGPVLTPEGEELLRALTNNARDA